MYRIVPGGQEVTADFNPLSWLLPENLRFIWKSLDEHSWHNGCIAFVVRGCLYFFLAFAAVLLQAKGAPTVPGEFPFQFHDGFLWVQVDVPQSDRPLNFLLDSGASVSVISLKTAQRLKLPLGRPVAVRGVETTSVGFFPQRLAAAANGVPLQKNYLAVDLCQLGRACNCCVDGLIGADFFHGKVLQIDFAEHEVRLLNSSDQADEETVLPLKIRQCGMEAPIQVNGGRPEFARLDTGCASALQWVTARIQPGKCSQRPAIALSRFMLKEMKTDVRFGSVQFYSVPTGVHSEEIFSGEAGLIGNGLLSHFKTVVIDARRGRLILGDQISD